VTSSTAVRAALALLVVVLAGSHTPSVGAAQTGATGAPSAPSGRAGDPPTPPGPGVVRLVSSPDLFNGDVGDVRGAVGWQPGDPNSWNASKRRLVDTLFGQLAAFDADSYLVAGDLVNGHWDKDHFRTGVFGPRETLPQVRARIRRAGAVYYGAWKGFWRDAGVPPGRVLAGVGDHEIGDNPWNHEQPVKRRVVGTFKSVWADHFTAGGRRFAQRPRGTAYEQTSYATYVTPRVLVVTVDVFRELPGHRIRPSVTGGHLAWFRDVLRRGQERGATIVVQGHTPVLGPVRTRSSSGLMLAEGAGSGFWRAMRAHDVDLYLAGEVHATSALHARTGPVQITHGGLAACCSTSFLTIDVARDSSVVVTSRTIPKVPGSEAGGPMWQTQREIPSVFRLRPYSVVDGRLRLGPDGDLVSQSGRLTAPGR